MSYYDAAQSFVTSNPDDWKNNILLQNGFYAQKSSNRNSGFIEIAPTEEVKRDGWKFHISSHPDDHKKATDIVARFAIEHGMVCKFAIGETLERMQNADYDRKGRTITLYSQEGVDMSPILQKLHAELEKSGVRTGQTPNGDRRLTGSSFITYRNDHDHRGEYVDSQGLRNIPEEKRYNPYGKPDPFEKLNVATSPQVKKEQTPTRPKVDLNDIPVIKASTTKTGEVLIDLSQNDPSQRKTIQHALEDMGVPFKTEKRGSIEVIAVDKAHTDKVKLLYDQGMLNVGTPVKETKKPTTTPAAQNTDTIEVKHPKTGETITLRSDEPGYHLYKAALENKAQLDNKNYEPPKAPDSPRYERVAAEIGAPPTKPNPPTAAPPSSPSTSTPPITATTHVDIDLSQPAPSRPPPRATAGIPETSLPPRATPSPAPSVSAPVTAPVSAPSAAPMPSHAGVDIMLSAQPQPPQQAPTVGSLALQPQPETPLKLKPATSQIVDPSKAPASANETLTKPASTNLADPPKKIVEPSTSVPASNEAKISAGTPPSPSKIQSTANTVGKATGAAQLGATAAAELAAGNVGGAAATVATGVIENKVIGKGAEEAAKLLAKQGLKAAGGIVGTGMTIAFGLPAVVDKVKDGRYAAAAIEGAVLGIDAAKNFIPGLGLLPIRDVFNEAVTRKLGEKYAPEKSELRKAGELAVNAGASAINSSKYGSMTTANLAAAIQKDPTLPDTIKIGNKEMLFCDALKDKTFRQEMIKNLEGLKEKGNDVGTQIAMIKAYGEKLSTPAATPAPTTPAAPATAVAQTKPAATAPAAG